jgi:hypothetical protein
MPQPLRGGVRREEGRRDDRLNSVLQSMGWILIREMLKNPRRQRGAVMPVLVGDDSGGTGAVRDGVRGA